jgi:hypothetical protein
MMPTHSNAPLIKVGWVNRSARAMLFAIVQVLFERYAQAPLSKEGQSASIAYRMCNLHARL